MIRWLQDRLHGRRFNFGQGNAEYRATVFGDLMVVPGQYGASVRWDADENSRHALAKLGPLHLMVTFARPRPVPAEDWTDGKSTLRSKMLAGGRELYVWRNWRHLGVTFELDRRVRIVRLEVGPFGMVVENY